MCGPAELYCFTHNLLLTPLSIQYGCNTGDFHIFSPPWLLHCQFQRLPYTCSSNTVCIGPVPAKLLEEQKLLLDKFSRMTFKIPFSTHITSVTHFTETTWPDHSYFSLHCLFRSFPRLLGPVLRNQAHLHLGTRLRWKNRALTPYLGNQSQNSIF